MFRIRGFSTLPRTFYGFTRSAGLDTELVSRLHAITGTAEIEDYKRHFIKVVESKGTYTPPYIKAKASFIDFYAQLIEGLDFNRFNSYGLTGLYYTFAKSKLGPKSLYDSIEAILPKPSEILNEREMSGLMNGLAIRFTTLPPPQKIWLTKLIAQIAKRPDYYLRDSRVYISTVHTIAKFDYGASLIPSIIKHFDRVESRMKDSPSVNLNSFSVLYSNLFRLSPDVTFINEKIMPRIAKNVHLMNTKHLTALLFYASEPGFFNSEFCEVLLSKMQAKNMTEDEEKSVKEARIKIDFLNAKMI